VISSPDTWKLTVVAEADAARISPAGSTCFSSIMIESFAGTETVVASATPSRLIEYVAIDPAVFVTTTELIRVVVAAGVV